MEYKFADIHNANYVGEWCSMYFNLLFVDEEFNLQVSSLFINIGIMLHRAI